MAKRPHGRPVMGMPDRVLAARLAELTKDQRLNVLLHVALGWKELCGRRKTYQPKP